MINYNSKNLQVFFNYSNLIKVNTMNGFKNRKQTIPELIVEIDKVKLDYLTNKFNSILERFYINKPRIENSFVKLFK